MGKGPLGEPWLCSESATTAPPSSDGGGGIGAAQLKGTGRAAGLASFPNSHPPHQPTALSGGGIQISQQPSKGDESGECSSSRPKQEMREDSSPEP